MTKHKLFVKFTCILLSFSLVMTPITVWAQDQPSIASDFAQGKIDGERDGKGNGMWVLGGFCCGIFGVAGAYFIKPDVPTQAIVGKSSDYILGYTESYKDKSRDKNTMYAVAGCLAASIINLIYYVSIAAKTTTTTY